MLSMHILFRVSVSPSIATHVHPTTSAWHSIYFIPPQGQQTDSSPGGRNIIQRVPATGEWLAGAQVVTEDGKDLSRPKTGQDTLLYLTCRMHDTN